jgi:cell fate (sporulation/competence/biofilm development) regulator YlbF (YheA/YmcA/DUF963 family)
MMLEEKAKELGRIIGQSGEYRAVKRANDALSGDRNAVAILGELEKLRTDAQRLIEQGQRPTEEMERQLDALLGKVQGNGLYQNVIVAQENFDKVMLRVNEWILEGIQKGGTGSIITLG